MVILQELINLFVIAMLDDEKKLDAVGLGNTIINLFGIAFFLGLNGALSTFVS